MISVLLRSLHQLFATSAVVYINDVTRRVTADLHRGVRTGPGVGGGRRAQGRRGAERAESRAGRKWGFFDLFGKPASPDVILCSLMDDRKVIHTRRMMKDVENRRVWSKARGRDNTPWYAQTLKLNSRGYLAASNAVMLCSLVDICVMMLDAVGYHSCSQLCHDNGGPFSSSSIHFRGHIGESFRTIKIALGILCDLMYLLYLGISFRTVLLCVSPCVSTVTLVLDSILFSSCFPASCALLRVHYARALFDQRLVWPQVRRRSSLANHGDISHTQIATGYLKSMFMTDLLTCAPLYWIFFDVPWVRVNRIFNVLRLNFDVEVVIKFLHAMKIKVMTHALHYVRPQKSFASNDSFRAWSRRRASSSYTCQCFSGFSLSTSTS